MKDEVVRWGKKIYCRYLDTLNYGSSICLSQWMQTNKIFMNIKVIINLSYANHQLFSVRYISCFIGHDGVKFCRTDICCHISHQFQCHDLERFDEPVIS